ncbi:hypothetical protein KY328_03655 [Candidatus Woesearchaeota archaeon]|nr:hypothetical protein [Candidatus Woesearchaeota archaeon]
MKNILISLVLVSGLAMAGDIVKCSEAEAMHNKYSDLYDQAVVREANIKTQQAYLAMREAWGKQGHKECEGILSKEQLIYFFGKQ